MATLSTYQRRVVNNGIWLTARYLIVVVLAIAFIIPFIWMVSTSLKDSGQAYEFPPLLIPHPATLDNYTALWGGTLEQIAFTIRHGVRNDVDDDAHISQMPAFLKDGILNRQQVGEVAEYVLQLAHKEHDPAVAARGAQVFKENCVACHGAEGGGNTEVGAPALNNDIWLYGGDRQTIIATVSNARRGVMPAWGKILDEQTIKKLAVYVHSLGGGR